MLADIITLLTVTEGGSESDAQNYSRHLKKSQTQKQQTLQRIKLPN